MTSEVHVGRILVDALVLDSKGDPIPDLSPADFRAKVAGRRAAVEAADWIAAAVAEGPAITEEGVRNAPGRVLVLFVQSGMRASQMIGLLRAWQAAAPLLDGLLPTDRVAVVAWGGHLRVVQDFTSDAGAVRAALCSALFGRRFTAGEKDAALPPLREALDARTLARTTSVERSLEALAGALGRFGGAKAVVFIGWGVAVNRAPSEWDSLERAMTGLRAARATLIALDSTDADFHTLQMGLQRISAATGGFYASLRNFPRMAIDLVARALSGRYVLTLIAPEGVTDPVDVELVSRRGSVTVRD